jgi:hypothetical protein
MYSIGDPSRGWWVLDTYNDEVSPWIGVGLLPLLELIWFGLTDQLQLSVKGAREGVHRPPPLKFQKILRRP